MFPVNNNCLSSSESNILAEEINAKKGLVVPDYWHPVHNDILPTPF
jgi:hypothetical protein